MACLPASYTPLLCDLVCIFANLRCCQAGTPHILLILYSQDTIFCAGFQSSHFYLLLCHLPLPQRSLNCPLPTSTSPQSYRYCPSPSPAPFVNKTPRTPPLGATTPHTHFFSRCSDTCWCREWVTRVGTRGGALCQIRTYDSLSRLLKGPAH